VDPLTEITGTPYQYCYQNPVRYTDPTGMKGTDEFDDKGNKISDLGGDKIDFYHQKNGDTKVVDRESGESNVISGGKSIIEGYTHRKKSTSWWTLSKEFDKGVGPTKSLIADFEDSTLGIFGSMDKKNSTYASKARTAVLSEGLNKGRVSYDYEEVNPMTAGFDMWEQFLGRANISYYKLGDDKVLFMINDSKSMTSLAYRLLPSWERSVYHLNGNTYQTYMWTESMSEVMQKGTLQLQYTPQQKVQMQQGQQGFNRWLLSY
jgi:hypothetical protein